MDDPRTLTRSIRTNRRSFTVPRHWLITRRVSESSGDSFGAVNDCWHWKARGCTRFFPLHAMIHYCADNNCTAPSEEARGRRRIRNDRTARDRDSGWSRSVSDQSLRSTRVPWSCVIPVPRAFLCSPLFISFSTKSLTVRASDRRELWRQFRPATREGERLLSFFKQEDINKTRETIGWGERPVRTGISRASSKVYGFWFHHCQV